MKQRDIIDRAFRPLYGRPCWNVQSGWGSFITLEFGRPHLIIDEPRPPKPSWSRGLREHFARRRIHVRGDWHLWFYCCEWHLYSGNKRVGDSALESSSKRRITRAVRFLDGQKLAHAELRVKGMRSIFEFDLGARLETRPYSRTSIQWYLYGPGGNVLSVRADKRYSYGPGNRHSRWLPITP